MLSIAPTKEREVYEALRKLPQVVDVHAIFGDYDMIAKVEADDLDTIGQFVTKKLRMIEGVKDTRTLSKITF